MGTRDEVLASQRFETVSRDFVAKTGMTISGFRTMLTQEVLPGELNPSTIDLYSSSLLVLTEVVGDKPLRDFTPLDVDLFKAARLRKVKPVTAHKEFRMLKAAFNRAQKYGMISENPFLMCKGVNVPKVRPEFLTKDDFRKLMGVVDDEQMRQIVVVGIHTAMRLGEILHLRVENIDLSRGFIHLENQPDFRLKSGQPRSVPIHPEAAKVLRPLCHGSGYVFPDKDGGVLPWRRVSRKFKSYARKAELSEGIRFHSLRHSGVTWFVQSGMPLPFVREIAGHSSISTTMIYAHAAPDELRESVQRIPSFLTN